MRISGTNALSGSKIKGVAELIRIIPKLKAKGKRIAFTNGCFDLLHYGHIQYLRKAKSSADILIVGLNSDSSVKRIKGEKRPIVNEKDRLQVLAELESVDYIVLFKENTPLKIIEAIKPHILIKGADWKKNKIIGSKIVLKNGGKVLTVKLVKGRSTTNLIKKIVKRFG